MGRIIDETGNRYGRLTVVRRDPENAYHKGANWICRCECGGERVASGIGLRQGLIKSCGCLIRETRVLRCACGYKGQKTRDWTPDWKCYRCSGLSPLQEPPKMTEDELFEKRAEHWRFYHRSAPTSASHDVMLFLERLEKVTKERDMAIEQHRLSQHEVARWVDRETKAARERDEARADLARSVAAWESAGMQGRTAHDAMLALAKERDEARAELAALRKRVVEALPYPTDDDSDESRTAEEAIEMAVAERDSAYRSRDLAIKMWDEARAEVERLRETKDYLRTWLSSEELEGLRVKAAEHPLLWEEIHHLKAEVERLSRLLKMAEDEAVAADDHGRREARRADAAEADAERLGAERDEARADAERYLADLRRCASEPYERTRELEALQAEVERLRGILPELPSRAPDGHGLPRYGLRWNGPSDPASVPMADGYWTPWHLASDAYRRGAEAMREACARMEPYAYNLDDHLMISKWRSLVRGLPIPEDK